jgi:hypothetical protein
MIYHTWVFNIIQANQTLKPLDLLCDLAADSISQAAIKSLRVKVPK